MATRDRFRGGKRGATTAAEIADAILAAGLALRAAKLGECELASLMSRDIASWNEVRQPDDWEAMFAQGLCRGFGEVAETPRFALIAGYIHRLYGQICVLDVGCGEGHLATYLDSGRADYVGFDPSPTAIAGARSRHPTRRFDCCSVEEFTPPDGAAYDAVVFNEVLPHLAEPIETMRRLRRCLRPGGALIVSLFQNPNPQSNGRKFAPMFEGEIANGLFKVLTSSEVTSREADLRWRVTVLV
jgi:2-polyprenyl-3-methyl-5-hydroxy-6-metoxy-1,4-benzoquinol methylase